MDKLGEKIKEALTETVNGLEASDDVEKRIAEDIRRIESGMPLEKNMK